MATLCERLLNAGEAGVFQLTCTQDELRVAAEQAQLALFEVDLSGVQGKGEFLAAVARAISAPEWFGQNFDALADALGDFSWRPAAGYVLLLCNGDLLGLGELEQSAVLEIFSEASDFWKQQGKPFWVLYS